ncbi:MAG: flavodoxin-dependent (E)-4-hydroxy-3-methylbut-2-enyl-diphosphate synthase, partial [Clostridia bacterium]|nr:flavodoxin-dependent (E)-4-hydroxy-3-methylbut-2-enyl-diphosphate synthase [Clostridia bacterium]
MTKVVNIGKVSIGGGNPVALQTMTNRDPHDETALLTQIRENALLGCDIIRLTVPDHEAAVTFGKVKKDLLSEGLDIPLVA